MRKTRLDLMVKGWFIGNFDPCLIRNENFEVAVKEYKKGDLEVRHYHKVATEITVIVSGRVKMNGIEFYGGDIVLIEPNEAVDFEALENSTTTVVKFPSVTGDKFQI